MYRLVTRRAAPQAAQAFSKRSFSNQGFRATKNYKSNMYFVAGLTFVPGFLAISFMNDSHIVNEVDKKKIEKGKQKAESSGDKKAEEKGKKESIGKAAVKTKVQPEEANPETRSEIGSEDASEEAKDEGAEDHQSAAYNPETGEINWDCPCLGGMAHGPCGEEFKEAFSCFIYSESEPKGVNCIQKFEAMRNCFREHPEHYKEELYDDEEQEPLVDVNQKKDSSELSAEVIADDATKVTKEKAKAEVRGSK